MNKDIELVFDEVGKIVKGKDDIIVKVVAAIIAGGHILLDDIPGVGKTTLAMSIGKALELDYRRMQFTPDVLPSDIVGFMMYNSNTKEFEYKKGSIFCNLYLADEINRTSSKTQSALLEAMEEGKVTVDGVSYELPKPFCVIATQNPVGSAGTQLLPESQLDRFMICVSMGYPSFNAAVDILKNNSAKQVLMLNKVIDRDSLIALRKKAEEIHVDDIIYDYIVKLTEETRNDERVMLGVSPRGSVALLRMARAMAVIRGNDYVIPEDVLDVINAAWNHRIKLNAKGRSEGITPADVIRDITERIKAV